MAGEGRHQNHSIWHSDIVPEIMDYANRPPPLFALSSLDYSVEQKLQRLETDNLF